MQHKMGIWSTTSLVVGNIVGTGILMLPSSLAALGNIGLLSWVVSTLGAMCLALVFSRLARRLPKAGGPFTYTQYAFGDFSGFQIAWGYWIANWVSNAAVIVAFVSYLSNLFPALRTHSGLALGVGMLALWSLTFANLFGAKIFKRIQIFVTLTKVLPLIVIGVLGTGFININHLWPLHTTGDFTPIGAISHGISLTLFSFLGLETATIPKQSIQNPEKVVPIATLLGTAISAVIYIWLNVVAIGVLGSDKLSQSTAPFADVGAALFGSDFGLIIAAFGAFACYATLNGWILLQGQVPMAAAKEYLLPRFLTHCNKHDVPVYGLIISSVLVSLLLAANYSLDFVSQFTFIVNCTMFAMLMPYIYSSVADLTLIIEGRKQVTRGYLFVSAAISAAGFGFGILAIIGIGMEVVYYGSIFMLFGLPFYVWARQNKKENLSASS